MQINYMQYIFRPDLYRSQWLLGSLCNINVYQYCKISKK